jgi:hypothetical protein
LCLVALNPEQSNRKSNKMKTISDLDSAISREGGPMAKVGRVKFVVALGREYDAEIISVHRTSRGAIRAAAKEGIGTVWMWDSYMGRHGGFRVLR